MRFARWPSPTRRSPPRQAFEPSQTTISTRASRLLLGAGEGVEGLLDQVRQFGGSVVLDPGEHGGGCRGQAGRHGDPCLEAGVRIVLVCFEGLEDDLLGGELTCPLAFAERWGGDDELDLREQG